MAYERIVRHVLFPLQQKLLGGGTLAYISEWERTQWLEPDELRQMQLDKLKNLLEHAAASVPYYRRTFREAGFEPGDLKEISDLAGLPVLDKSILREHRDEFITEGLTEKLRIAKTGGSTGEPLAFPVGSSLRAAAVANMARCRRWWGIETGERAVNIWGHSRFIKETPRQRVGKAVAAVKNRLLNRIVCSAYDLGDESMHRYWKRIERFRPAFIIGYATSLYTFADFLTRNSLPGETLGLKAIISTAEVLYDWQREALAAAFGAPVVNEYGMCEAGILAYECPKGSMHLMDEAFVVEILPVEGSPSGDIVITELENPAAPLIRYNTKDMAGRVEGKCECGRGLSRLTPIEGRAYDIIYAADGSVVAGALLTHTMKSLEGVGKYQILQRDLSTLEVSYVSGQPLSQDDEDFITRTLTKHMGEIRIDLNRVDKVPGELSGKHRWLKSHVTAQDARGAGGRGRGRGRGKGS